MSIALANTGRLRRERDRGKTDSAGGRFTSAALSADSQVPGVSDAGIVQVLDFQTQVFLVQLLSR
jgi:hypothetical protein